jgi:uncharacterized protein YggE
MKTKIITLGTVGVLALGILVGSVYNLNPLKVIASTTVATQDNKEGTIVVNGIGEYEVKPDTAYINVGVTVEEKDAKAAQEKAKKLMNEVYSSLEKLNIKKDDIKTINFFVEPIRDYNQQKEGNINMPYPIVGYRVDNQVEIIIRNIDEVGTIIDTVAGKQNVTIGNIRFSLLNDKAAKAKAIEDAVSKAKFEADTTAKALGVKVARIKMVNVNTNSGAHYPVYPMMNMAKSEMLSDRSEPTSISSGNVKINANVAIEFTLIQ